MGTVHGKFTHLGALDWAEEDFLREFGVRLDEFIVSTRAPRLRFIRKLALAKQGVPPEEIDRMEKSGKLRPDRRLGVAKNYQIVRSPDDPKGRWVDGTPENTFHAFGLHTLFEGARFVHILRSPDDVAKSLMNFSKAGGAGKDFGEKEAFATWTRYVSRAHLVERALGSGRVYRLGYSELIQNPRGELEQLLGWLGEPFEESVLSPLAEKINSSRASVDLSGTTRAGKEARDLFGRLTAGKVPPPCEQARTELHKLYDDYVQTFNAPLLSAALNKTALKASPLAVLLIRMAQKISRMVRPDRKLAKSEQVQDSP